MYPLRPKPLMLQGVRALAFGPPERARRVLLHGFTQSPESWSAVVSHLVTPDAIALELPGHGGDRAEGIESFGDAVEHLAVAISTLGQEFELVGYSLGARLSLGLLLAHPTLFSRATLIGVHPGLETEVERAERRQQDWRQIELLEREGLEAFLEAWEALPIWATQTQALRASQRAWRRTHDPLGLARSLRTQGLAEMPSTWPRLMELTMPVALVLGARDPKFLSLAERMKPMLAQGSLWVVSDAGHNVPLEAPRALAALISNPAALEGREDPRGEP